jgi:hypothetical protein
MIISQVQLTGIVNPSPEEYQFSNTGVVLNGPAVVPFVDVTEVDGLDSADVRQQTHDRDGFDGGWVDAEFETIRTVTLQGNIYADPFATEAFLDLLLANYAPTKDPVPLFLATDYEQRYVLCKSLGMKFAKTSDRNNGIVPFQVQLLCEDPRKYSLNVITARASLQSFDNTGLGFPLAFNFGFGSSSSSNTCNLFLAGNRQSPGQMTIQGPVLNPRIVNDTLGITMEFSLSLAATDQLVVDLGNRSVMLNGTANRRYSMTFSSQGWYMFQPGANTLRLEGYQNGIQTPTLTAQAFSAWR